MTTDELREAVRKWDGDLSEAFDLCAEAYVIYARPFNVTETDHEVDFDEDQPTWVKALAHPDADLYPDETVKHVQGLIDEEARNERVD